MNEEVVRQLNDKQGVPLVHLRMQLFNMNGKLTSTCTVTGPKEMDEETANWIAKEIKTVFNSEGKATY